MYTCFYILYIKRAWMRGVGCGGGVCVCVCVCVWGGGGGGGGGVSGVLAIGSHNYLH